MLRGGSYNAKKADIFSFGIMLYIMLYAQFPFKQWADTLTRDISFPELPQISDAAKDLMRSMVSREVSKRVELDAICQHPWVAQVTSCYKHVQKVLSHERHGGLFDCSD